MVRITVPGIAPSIQCVPASGIVFGTRVEHELMVQSRGGHSSVVTATLEHSKKDVFQPDVAVVISDWSRNILIPDCCTHPLDAALDSYLPVP